MPLSILIVRSVEAVGDNPVHVDQCGMRKLFSTLKESGFSHDLDRMAPPCSRFEELIQLHLRGAFAQIQKIQD
ncbi:MAG: hypothetical protein HY273_15925 [Gammaproteobacteria bacterium]|nr:hypothetical protein [Gammaproteobacteria bacterium]